MDSADAKAAFAQAYAAGEEPRLVSVAPSGRDEMWALGNAAFVLPVIPSGASAELEYALRLRREASFSGKCDQCGAVFGFIPGQKTSTGSLSHAIMPHRRNCPAHDDNVGPLLLEHYSEEEAKSIDVALQEASSRARKKIEEAIPDRVVVERSKENQDWAEALIDQLLDHDQRCGHLRTRPVQTWNILLGTTMFRCGECWAYFQASIADGSFRLPMVEDLTCDHCRRYSSSLAPLGGSCVTLRLAGRSLRGVSEAAGTE